MKTSVLEKTTENHVANINHERRHKMFFSSPSNVIRNSSVFSRSSSSKNSLSLVLLFQWVRQLRNESRNDHLLLQIRLLLISVERQKCWLSMEKKFDLYLLSAIGWDCRKLLCIVLKEPTLLFNCFGETSKHLHKSCWLPASDTK